MRLYDSNCHERLECGQIPFETFEDYYNKYTGWLKNKYAELEASTRSWRDLLWAYGLCF